MTGTTPTGETKRALRALVADDAIDGPTGDAADRVVAEATRATADVERAVAFLAADGVERLARAVVTAARNGDEATVRRGREALSTLRAFRAALDGPTEPIDGRDDEGPDDETRDEDHGVRDESRRSTPDAGRSIPDTGRSTPDAEPTAAPATDHFHSGRGTVLGDGGKRRDR